MGIQVFFTYHQFRKKQYQNKSYQRRRENKITKNRKKLDNIKISQYCQKQINNIKYFNILNIKQMTPKEKLVLKTK